MLPPSRPALALLALALYLAAFASYTALRRNANWDLVPYVALALGGAPDEALHRATFDELEADLPAAEFAEFTGSEEYRRRVFTEPQVFAEQLGFYAYRKGFPWALAGLHRLGIGWRSAGTLISVGAGTLLALVALIWGARAGWIGLGLAGLWIPASGAIDIARLWTPDTLGALFAFGGVYLWIVRGLPLVGMLALVASLVARSSNVVFVAFLLAALAWSAARPRERVLALAGLAATGSLYLLLSRLGNGWWPMFVHTCVERVPLPQSETPVFSFAVYGRALAEGLPYFHLTKASLWIAVTATLAALPGTTRVERWIALGLLASTFVQFLAAPVLWDRLYVCQQLVTGMLLVERMSRGSGSSRPHKWHVSFPGRPRGVESAPRSRETHCCPWERVLTH